MENTWIKDVVLKGERLGLEPLAERHLGGLRNSGRYPEIWEWMPYSAASPDAFAAVLRQTEEQRRKGIILPFAVILKETGECVGSSSYLAIDSENRRLEIGGTWITPRWQRSFVNTEAKYLMLEHAFEHLRCLRVEFKTDVLNSRSRAALLRIGAKEEGTFRRHMIVRPSGRVRDSVYYSVVDQEWLGIKTRLQEKMGAHSC